MKLKRFFFYNYFLVVLYVLAINNELETVITIEKENFHCFVRIEKENLKFISFPKKTDFVGRNNSGNRAEYSLYLPKAIKCLFVLP